MTMTRERLLRMGPIARGENFRMTQLNRANTTTPEIMRIIDELVEEGILEYLPNSKEWRKKWTLDPMRQSIGGLPSQHSMAMAAHYFGCDFVGTELDPDYFAAAQERFYNETAQEAMF